MVNPTIVRIMPAMGSKGMIGHKMISTRLATPLRIIRTVPVMSKIKREIKPMKRETKRSRNM